MSEQKLAFVRAALAEGANVSALCRENGIGRTLGHRLIKRYLCDGEAGLEPRSRRPHRSPLRTTVEDEAKVMAVRARHPAWGGRKIAKVLSPELCLGPSTVTKILARNGVELGRFGGGAKPMTRFEHEAPNDLWQMDFKGHVAMRSGRLHPLTVLDDHSRYSIVLAACENERRETVRQCLIEAFRRYGLPTRMAMDNGSPWGDRHRQPYTKLTIWLIEAGIAVSHSRPAHPQTLGKDERFHRSLKIEALEGPPFPSIEHARLALDRWRHIYNHERPHEALDLQTPASRYKRSERSYRETPAPFEHAADHLVRKVDQLGRASLNGRIVRITKALHGKIVGFQPTQIDGTFDVFFRHQFIKTIDLSKAEG